MNNTLLNMIAPLCFPVLALRAQSHEFQQVAADAVARFLFQTPFESVQLAVGEIRHSSAVTADQVVMVLTRTLAPEIAAAGVAYMNLTEQAVLLKQSQCAVYGNQADARIIFMQPVMDIGRLQVFPAVSQHGNYGLPLGSQLEPALPQLRLNILNGHIYYL
jgi:hypothetical protein